MGKSIWFKKIFFAVTLILLLFSGCGGGIGDVTTGDESSSGTKISINWPEGYSYNQANGEITIPSGKLNATLPAYVTKITLTITGEGIDPPIVLDVPLDTLKVNFAVTPGIRAFTLVIETSIEGLTFTAIQTIDLVPGAQIHLDFDLTLNAPPVVDSVGASDTTPQTGAAITVSCNATDPDNNPMSYDWSDGEAGGSFSGSGASVSYTATNGGAITISCEVSDGKGGTDSGSVTVDANAQPVVSSVKASDSAPFVGDSITTTCNATDPDGDSLGYSWSDRGAGGSFSGSGSSVSYTPANGGSIKITCTVTDGRGGTGSGSVTITANLSPTVTASNTSPKVGDEITLTCDSGASLTYSWSDGGAGGTFTGSGSPVKYKVAKKGSVTVTCTVTDGRGGTGSGTVILNASSGTYTIADDICPDACDDIWTLAGIAIGASLTLECETFTYGTGTNLEISVSKQFAAGAPPSSCVFGGGNIVAQDPDLDDTEPPSTINWTAAQSTYCLDFEELCGAGCDDGSYICTLTSTSAVTVTQIYDED